MKISQLLLVIALSVGISIPSTLLVGRYLAPPVQIASINLKQLISQYTTLLQEQQIPDSEIAMKAKQFEYQLKLQLLRYINSHNAVVLVEPAVIDGAVDITSDIRQLMGLPPQ